MTDAVWSILCMWLQLLHEIIKIKYKWERKNNSPERTPPQLHK